MSEQESSLQKLIKEVADLRLHVEERDTKIASLLERIEASKAAALRYQIKFETASELFDRLLNSTKQERY